MDKWSLFKKPNFRDKKLETKKTRGALKWVFVSFLISFCLSILMSLLSNSVIDVADNIIVAGIVLIIIVVMGIIFDIIGTAVTAAEIKPLHAMAARRLYGARIAVKLVRNADKVANICNDIVGDICGIISGAAAAYIIAKIEMQGVNPVNVLLGLGITGLVASITVGGKALGKSFAIRKSSNIIWRVGIVLSVMTFTRNKSRLKDKNLKDTKKKINQKDGIDNSEGRVS